jgi:hypothetical protein
MLRLMDAPQGCNGKRRGENELESHRMKVWNVCCTSLFLVVWLDVGVAHAQVGSNLGQPPQQAQAPQQQAAQQQVDQQPFDASEIGHATHAWFALQVSGAEAAPRLPTPGAQADLAYMRYMASFNAKIPAQLGSTIGGAGQGATPSDYPESGGQQ